MDNSALLKFVPFNSSINPSFWHKLTQIKLDVDRLSENNKEIWGYFTNLPSEFLTFSLLEVDSTSFNKDLTIQNFLLPSYGCVLNKNTIEQFKECNKGELIYGEGNKILEDVKNGSAIKNPSLLNRFFILSFADLKKYNYYYWFAFPAPGNLNIYLSDTKIKPIIEVFNEQQLQSLYNEYFNLDVLQKPFFLIKTGSLEIVRLESVINFNEQSTNLNDFEEYYFAFSDPCTSKDYPGWPLRNYITLLLYHCKSLHGKTIKVLCVRLARTEGAITLNNSEIFTIALPDFKENFELFFNEQELSWAGWERNESAKFGPRMVNLKNALDPKCLAETSVDLNLKLMKWRVVPDINLEKIKSTKSLVLGSGTLGCAVARTLLGWGVRNITFVDNSKVAFSNPVRQHLFNYEDSLHRKPKAETAAENLKKIFPGVNSQGFNLTIPMPGHPVGESLYQKTEEAVIQLTELISSHDLVFLLLDSRESRWLPTLLCAHFGKILINAALGFDTYLVMRHGVRSQESVETENEVLPGGFRLIPGEQLSCYFCNDITAPGDSLKDRTLDQQCTVARPGVSSIAGALAVELAVSILQHKLGPSAPAFYKVGNVKTDEVYNENECVLGIVPHSVRGFLSTFSQILPATKSYSKCTACSPAVLDEYKKRGFQFLLDVFNSSKYLEDLTGISTMLLDTKEDEVWDLSDDD